MLEKEVERHLVFLVKTKLQGKAIKFKSPANRSYPDRLCMAPGGILFFVECKAPGKKPTIKQAIKMDELRRFGQHVHVCDTKVSALAIVMHYAEIQTENLDW